MRTPARLYCTCCMTTFIGERCEANCPSCEAHNFILLRGGDFGCAIHFDQAGIGHDDFTDWDAKDE